MVAASVNRLTLKKKEKKYLRQRIYHLAWPVILEMASVTVTELVDLMMVGRLGPAAITAIGLGILPIHYMIHLCNALGVGTTALVARYIGGGSPAGASRVMQQSLVLGSLLALFGGVSFVLGAPYIFSFFGAAPEVLRLGTAYLRLMAPGFVFMFLVMVMTAGLRGAGDTRTPMKVNLVVNILNVIGNYLLIFGHLGFPALGVNGAAISSSLARTVGALLIIFILLARHNLLRIPRHNLFTLDFELLRRIIRIGLPASGEQLVMRVGQLFFVRLVASLGTVAYAAHQIALKAEALSYMPGMGLAVATATLVGNNLGAKKPGQAEASAYESWKLCMVLMGLMSLVFLLLPEYLVRLFSPDPDIIELGANCLRIIAIAQLPMGTHFIFSWGLRGAGETRSVFYSTALATWFGRLGAAYIFINILGLGLYGAWLAMIIDWVGRGIYVALRFRKGYWKKIEV